MTAGKRITKNVVDGLDPETIVWDREVRGFGVRRRRRDTTYVLKYRANGVQRFVTIGKHGAPWTSETARKEAQRLLGAIHAGDDPAVQRDRLKREPDVAAVLDRYLREHVEAHNKPSTATEAKRQVERNIKPIIGELRISLLTRADVKRWHGAFSDRPYEGNRGLAYLRKALTLAWKDWELRNDNPALGVKMFPEQRRERFYSDEELSRIGAALTAFEDEAETIPGAVHAVRLLALTGMRLGEVLGLRWAWIDFQAGCARLPDAKAGARAVPLGGPALAYLTSIDRTGEFVCSGTDPSKPLHLKTFRRFWEQLRERAELVDGRPHDFRHTVGTFSAQTGANAFQVRDLLGHRTMAMTGRYVNRSVDPLRKTADAVSERISAALGSGKGAEIVPLVKGLGK